jgi:hypothetical protein
MADEKNGENQTKRVIEAVSPNSKIVLKKKEELYSI